MIFCQQLRTNIILQGNSSVEKAGIIARIKMRGLTTDDKFSLRGRTLQSAIKEDSESGMIPIFVWTLTFKCIKEFVFIVNHAGI